MMLHGDGSEARARAHGERAAVAQRGVELDLGQIARGVDHTGDAETIEVMSGGLAASPAFPPTARAPRRRGRRAAWLPRAGRRWDARWRRESRRAPRLRSVTGRSVMPAIFKAAELSHSACSEVLWTTTGRSATA